MLHAGALTSSPNTPLTGGGLLGSDSATASYKAAATAAIKEYMSSSDLQEVSSTLEELKQPHLAHVFVKQVNFNICAVLGLDDVGWGGLGCAVLCCAVLCCAVLCCAVLCCAVLCRAVSHCAPLCRAVLCCAVLCCAVLCCAVLCCAVLCCAVLCCAVLRHNVVCCPALRHGNFTVQAASKIRSACSSRLQSACCMHHVMVRRLCHVALT